MTKSNMSTLWQLSRSVYEKWRADNVSRLAAALAFYTAVSIAPLLIIVLSLTGYLWGSVSAAKDELLQKLTTIVDPEVVSFMSVVVKNANAPKTGSVAGMLGLLTLLWGSTNVFTQLQNALNAIWGSAPEPDMGVQHLARKRFLSFAMVLAIAFLLLVSLLVSAALAVLATWFSRLLPGAPWFWQAVNFTISLGVVTFLFAALFKILPDANVAWRDVWIGAAVTAVLFTFGKFLIGLYLANETFTSTYGAAGSLVVFLLWVFFSAQIFFVGAEFTQVYSRYHGRGIVLSDAEAEPADVPSIKQSGINGGRERDEQTVF